MLLLNKMKGQIVGAAKSWWFLSVSMVVQWFSIGVQETVIHIELVVMGCRWWILLEGVGVPDKTVVGFFIVGR